MRTNARKLYSELTEKWLYRALTYRGKSGTIIYYGKENGGKIKLYLPGETRTYQIFAARYADPTDQTVYMVGFAHDETFFNYLQNIKAQSLYDTGVGVNKDDNVIMLSTCANGGSSRFVVHAKLVDSRIVE